MTPENELRTNILMIIVAVLVIAETVLDRIAYGEVHWTLVFGSIAAVFMLVISLGNIKSVLKIINR